MRLWHVSVMLASVIGFHRVRWNGVHADRCGSGPTTPAARQGRGHRLQPATWVGTAVDSSGTTMGMSTGFNGHGDARGLDG